MKKRGIMLSLIVFAFLLILSTNLISAQYGLDDALNFIGGENILLIITFGVSFAILLWVLGKFFKENKGVPLIISILLSLGITQAVNMMNFGLDISTGGFGLSSDIFGLLIGIVVLVVFILMLWKAKMHTVWILGILIAFIGVIGGVEVNYVAVALGVALVLIYALFLRKKEPGESRMPSKGVIFTVVALGVIGTIVWLLYSGGSQAGAGIRIFTNPLAITIIAIALFLLVLFVYAYGKKKKYEELEKGKLILFSIFGSLIIAGIVWMLYSGGVGAKPGFDWFATNPLALLILGIAGFFIFAFILFKSGKKKNHWKKLVALIILLLIGLSAWFIYSGNVIAGTLFYNPVLWIVIGIGAILIFILIFRGKKGPEEFIEKEKKAFKSTVLLIFFIILTIGALVLVFMGYGHPTTLYIVAAVCGLMALVMFFSKKKVSGHIGEHKKGYGKALLLIILGLAIAGIGYFWTGLISTVWALVIGGVLFAIGATRFYLIKKRGERDTFREGVSEIKRGGGKKKWFFLILAIGAGILGVFGLGSPMILFIIAVICLIIFIILLMFGRKSKKGSKEKSTFSEAMKKRGIKPKTKKEEKLERHLKEIEKSKEKEEIEKKKLESKRLKTNWEESKKIFLSVISKKDIIKIKRMYDVLLVKYSNRKFPGLERQISEIRAEIKKIYEEAMKGLEEQRQNDSQAESLVNEITEETNSGLRRINSAQSAKKKLSRSKKMLKKINKKIRDLKKFMKSVELSDETAERLDQRLQFLEQTHFRILKLREDLRKRLEE